MGFEEAEMKIKAFIARARYGDTDNATYVLDRDLVFAPNYADGCGGRAEISSIIMELEGTPSKGIIASVVTGKEVNPNGKEYFHFGFPYYLGRSRIAEYTAQDAEEITEALDVFVAKSGIPLHVDPTTSIPRRR